jgi:hypothetical protein
MSSNRQNLPNKVNALGQQKAPLLRRSAFLPPVSLVVILIRRYHVWNKVKVYPWIGEFYESNKLLPYRTLILGESNYTTEENFDFNLVIACIKDHIGENSDDNFSRFATKTRRVILGRETKVTAKEFWENVAFYNFIQFRVGDLSKQRPTQKMWNDSILAFEELVNNIKPERILVLGQENWTNLLAHIDHKKINDFMAKFIIGDNSIMAGYIVHPSAGGGHFTYKKYGPIAKQIVIDGEALSARECNGIFSKI